MAHLPHARRQQACALLHQAVLRHAPDSLILLPQILLCGLIVPRDQMHEVLETIARLLPMTYAYDALNRVTLITFHDGSRQAYAYDQGANGIGRLSSITETNAANQVTSVIAPVPRAACTARSRAPTSAASPPGRCTVSAPTI